MVRVVLDTVIYNRAVEYPEFGKILWQACQLGYIKLISTHVQRDQLAATPDTEKRDTLLSFFDATSPELTPTAALVWDVSKWDHAEFPDEERVEFFKKTLGQTAALHLGHANDALLAVTAFARADMFVTGDGSLLRRTRSAVLQSGSNLAVLDYKEFAAELTTGRAHS
jgi:hypothetical protein